MPNNQGMVDFMRQMTESLEVLKKKNEDLNTRLTVAEARNSRRDREREEWFERERQSHIRKGKWVVDPN
jgi:hypothetical protein